MAWKIENGKAIVETTYQGKPAKFVIRKPKLKDFAFLLDECMVMQGKEVSIKLGKLIIGVLPKCLEEAPFPTNTENILNMEADASIMELVNATMTLMGFTTGAETTT